MPRVGSSPDAPGGLSFQPRHLGAWLAEGSAVVWAMRSGASLAAAAQEESAAPEHCCWRTRRAARSEQPARKVAFPVRGLKAGHDVLRLAVENCLAREASEPPLLTEHSTGEKGSKIDCHNG